MKVSDIVKLKFGECLMAIARVCADAGTEECDRLSKRGYPRRGKFPWEQLEPAPVVLEVDRRPAWRRY
jgi:uncharacterized protein YodC (DUF2158 family)